MKRIGFIVGSIEIILGLISLFVASVIKEVIPKVASICFMFNTGNFSESSYTPDFGFENGDFYACAGKNGKAPQIHSMFIEDNIFYADFSPVKSVHLKNPHWHCPHKRSFNDDITHVEFEIDNTWTYIRLEITDSNGYKALGNPYFLT